MFDIMIISLPLFVSRRILMEEDLKKELHKIIDDIENLNVLQYLIEFIRLKFKIKAGQ